MKILKNHPELDRLRYSIMFGWVIITLCLVVFPIFYSFDSGSFMTGLIMAGIILSIRYSMIKPVFRAAGEGAKVVGIMYIFDSLFSRRNQHGAATIGALIGALFIIVLIIMKNAIVCTYYLIRETFEFYKLIKKQKNVVQEYTVAKEN